MRFPRSRKGLSVGRPATRLEPVFNKLSLLRMVPFLMGKHSARFGFTLHKARCCIFDNPRERPISIEADMYIFRKGDYRSQNPCKET